jgi:single-strand DNA-binding protein
MYSLNRSEIIGNLTRDPELKTIANGQSVCNFAVATNRRWKDKDGNTQDSTEYHEMVIWGKQGELASQMLSKGKKVYIEGRLQTRSWDGTDGVKRYKTEIVVENFIPLAPKDGANAFDLASALNDDDSTSKPKKETKKADDGATDEINLDDIPF